MGDTVITSRVWGRRSVGSLGVDGSALHVQGIPAMLAWKSLGRSPNNS